MEPGDIAARALPGRPIELCGPLAGGLRNENVLLRLGDTGELLVLRIYKREPAACAKEFGLLHAAAGTIPVPEVVCADEPGAWLIYRYVEGVTFQELKQKGNRDDMAEASFALGKVLAAVSSVAPSWISRRPRLQIEGPAHLRKWMARIEEADEENSLVHGDFNNRNAIFRREGGEWTVAAILDWESAFIGSPLWDAARFICYENPLRPLREPFFSDGYRAGGGKLPEDWTEFSRAINAVSAAESLCRPDLPACVVSELRELVNAASIRPAQTP